ncbi:MAG: hypothetical protein MUP90_02370 [Gammaproteobacteria bacterium]|nr:hypothetical protein [Gammaproteobacteria bacterium]
MHRRKSSRVIKIRIPACLGLPAALLFGLSACTTSIPIETSIPTPLIAPLPNRVAVYYDPGLSNFEHTEKIVGGTDYQVKLGDANQRMFAKLFTSMFEEVVQVDSLEQAFSDARGFDAIINPAITELQIAPPSKLESAFFEAWIKYRIDAFDKDRKPIVNWVVTGYGKAEPEMFNSSDALRAATVTAMRDAAANIVIKFKRQPRVREWIQEQERLHAAPSE